MHNDSWKLVPEILVVLIYTRVSISMKSGSLIGSVFIEIVFLTVSNKSAQ